MNWLFIALVCSIGGLPGLVLLARFGRWRLDKEPTPENACRVANLVHVLVIPLLLLTTIGAVFTGRALPLWRVPVPEAVGLVLSLAALVLLLAATANLVLRGSGSPILIAFTRRLASSGLYARTRNPIILGAFLLLVSTGLWMQSLFMLAWAAGLFLPVILYFLKTYEERELEIRFGEGYRVYRDHTPMLFPRLW